MIATMMATIPPPPSLGGAVVVVVGGAVVVVVGGAVVVVVGGAVVVVVGGAVVVVVGGAVVVVVGGAVVVVVGGAVVVVVGGAVVVVVGGAVVVVVGGAWIAVVFRTWFGSVGVQFAVSGVVPSTAFDTMLLNVFHWMVWPAVPGLIVCTIVAFGIWMAVDEIGPVKVRDRCVALTDQLGVTFPPVKVTLSTLWTCEGIGMLMVALLIVTVSERVGSPDSMSRVTCPPAVAGSGVSVTVTGTVALRLMPRAEQFAATFEVCESAPAPLGERAITIAAIASAAAVMIASLRRDKARDGIEKAVFMKLPPRWPRIAPATHACIATVPAPCVGGHIGTMTYLMGKPSFRKVFLAVGAKFPAGTRVASKETHEGW